MTHSFANVLYLSICMLWNCSCFYCRLLTFFKIKCLQINHPGPPSECLIVWIQIKTDIMWSSSGFKLFANGYWQTTKLSAGMQRVQVNTLAFNILSHIGSFQHVYVYHKYSGTFKTFDMLCSLNKAKSNFQGI